jgi:hypothetical protein
MTGPPTDREALIAALADQAGGGASELRPEPEQLLDYLAGRLDPEEEERVSRQILASPEASAALLDLAELEAAGAEAGERPADLAALAGWRDLERRLPAAPSRFQKSRTLLPSIAAAVLLVTTVGLGLDRSRLQSELSRPVANLQSRELVTRRAGSEQVFQLSYGVPLRLVMTPAARCPVYRAEINGRPVREELKRDDLGNLSLLLLRTEPGAYGLRLSGCGRELETIRFRITADDD